LAVDKAQLPKHFVLRVVTKDIDISSCGVYLALYMTDALVSRSSTRIKHIATRGIPPEQEVGCITTLKPKDMRVSINSIVFPESNEAVLRCVMPALDIGFKANTTKVGD
jgi:hypothetical protein